MTANIQKGILPIYKMAARSEHPIGRSMFDVLMLKGMFGADAALDRAHPQMVNLPDIGVARKI